MPTVKSWISLTDNPVRACEEIISGIKEVFLITPPEGILLFTTSSNFERGLSLFRKTFPETAVFGCSASCICTEKTASFKGTAALAFKTANYHISPNLFIHNGKANALRNSISQQTYSFIKNKQKEKHLFLLLSTLEKEDYSYLIKGFQDFLGKRFPIIGTVASDNFQYNNTYCFFNDKIETRSSIGILLSGEMSFGFGIHNGWKSIGVPKPLTKKQKNLIRLIQNQPASEFYNNYLGSFDNKLKKRNINLIYTMYPLGIRVENNEELIIRNVLSTQSDGTLICQNEIPDARNVRLMISSKTQSINALKKAALEAKRSYHGDKPAFVLVFNPSTRYKTLRYDLSKDVQMLNEIFDKSIPKIGFYGYGQYAPSKQKNEDAQTCLQDQSALVLAIGDK